MTNKLSLDIHRIMTRNVSDQNGICSSHYERDISGPPDELGLKEMHGHAQNGLTCVNIILYLFSLILDQEKRL